MNSEIPCPTCGSLDWKAVEQFTSLTPCRLTSGDGGNPEIEFDARAEHTREAATSVTTAYICANEECGHTVQPEELRTLVGGRG
jgi:hypothetical protein